MERVKRAAVSRKLMDGRLAEPCEGRTFGCEQVWPLVLMLRHAIDRGAWAGNGAVHGFSYRQGTWYDVSPCLADLLIEPATGTFTQGLIEPDTAACELLELHLPYALTSCRTGHRVALLGQSLDGFIATRSGDSRYINGHASLVHLHRLRALSDAVVIGVGTALADAPQLTTRHVPGPHPVRVVIDPHARLPATSGLVTDGAAPTLLIRAADGRPCETRLSAQATAIHLPAKDDGCIEPATIVEALARRGLTRLLIEGGGITVARFLEAGLLDRLQLAVSPVIVGAGRPALPIRPAERLNQALRPPARRYLLGEDVLFDMAPQRDPVRAAAPLACV